MLLSLAFGDATLRAAQTIVPYRFHILNKSVKPVSSQYEINIECENDILDDLVVCF